MNRYFLSLLGVVLCTMAVAQMSNDKLYFRFNLGLGIGFNSVDRHLSYTEDLGYLVSTNSTTLTINPGMHFSPEVAFGARIYKGLSAEVGLAYLVNFAYSNVNGDVISQSFSRLHTALMAKYALELAEGKFALTPGLGFSFLPSNKMKFRFLEQRETIQYKAAVGLLASLEAQIRLGKKLILNPGIRYRSETYKANDVSTGQPVSTLPAELETVKANGIQLIIGLIIPLAQD